MNSVLLWTGFNPEAVLPSMQLALRVWTQSRVAVVLLLVEQMRSYIVFFGIRAVKKGRQQAKLGHETTWNNQVIAQAWDNFAAIHLFVNWLLHVVVLWWVLRDKQVRRSWGMQLIFYPCGYHGATDRFCSLYAQSSGAGRGGSGSGLERFTFICSNCMNNPRKSFVRVQDWKPCYRLCVETILTEVVFVCTCRCHASV